MSERRYWGLVVGSAAVLSSFAGIAFGFVPWSIIAIVLIPASWAVRGWDSR